VNTATASAARIRGNQTSPASAPAVRASWPMGEWESADDFETWWARLVWAHPNKNRNAVAKTKAIELVMAGALRRKEFDEGYAALRAANGERWTEQRGRYAPNLWQVLDDQQWKHAPPVMPAVGEYPSAEEYLRRIKSQ